MKRKLIRFVGSIKDCAISSANFALGAFIFAFGINVALAALFG